MRGKRILLGITGSIAAYKSALLTRLLVKAGAEVRVVMTDSAKEFITPLTMSVLSKHKVYCASHDKESGEWSSHVDLGLWADAFVIAPASANTIAKMSQGMADSFLLTCYLSARCPVFIAPAMDLDMYRHPAVRENINKLMTFSNHHLILPTDGELASGLFGEGRMEEPEKIFSIIEEFMYGNLPLRGKRALVTAGPTYESIDPVRFIGNRSSGKMGFAIAEELSKRGASVTLVSGPSALTLNDHTVARTDVKTADEMLKECMKEFPEMDIVVMSAAVADFKAGVVSEEKIARTDKGLSLTLTPTTDILRSMGEKRKPGQVIVGFALETDEGIIRAKEKLERKNVDMIVLNSMADEGAGFEVSTNVITIIDRSGKEKKYDRKLKSDVAKDVVDALMEKIK